MIIKDIVNRDIVNLTNCDHEPIHIPGSIQPHGFLIAFKKQNQVIDYCSGNISEFITLRHEQVLSKTIEEVFGAELTKDILHSISRSTENFPMPLQAIVNEKLFSISTHQSDDVYIVEFEPGSIHAPDPSTFYTQTRKFASYMEKATSLQGLCQRIAEATRTITGYDRVMIYRFDKDYNGEVYAESKRDDIESFFGLHYPHTDIPAQARELYKQNLLRLIVDVNYLPVPLYTIDDHPSKNLNLGHAALRSVSPIHVQYLHNIGVGATLTISLMHEEKLWGLIACHHYSAKYIDSFTRVSAQLQGHFITSQINVRQVAEQHAITLQIQSALDSMVSRRFSVEKDSLREIIRNDDLLKLCNASGVAIVLEEEIFSNGVVPDDTSIRKLVNALGHHAEAHVLHSSKLIDIYPEGEALRETAAGILYHSLGDLLKMGIIWFREETIKEVKWAGEPSKAIIKNEFGLSPRKSFALWKEEIKFQSNEWHEPELSAAANFAHYFERQAHLFFLMTEENKYRLLSEKLKITNDELENINWISTHDLKEPLRKIQLFASRMIDSKTENLSQSMLDTLSKINRSANRMQQLISDILEYSKIRQVQAVLETTDLTRIVHELVDEMKEDMEETGAKITIGELPVIKGNILLLRQLFSNVIRNSLKYSRKDIASRIIINFTNTVTHPLPAASGVFYEITIEDNGIGFAAAYNESIFNVFTRLHAQSAYDGSGVGLALCRKIMQSHHGYIVAQGKENEGAVFILYFPAHE